MDCVRRVSRVRVLQSYLSILGVVSVFLAVLISFGLCSAMGVFFGPVHNILPLLLLGLGVDDMFVILQVS